MVVFAAVTLTTALGLPQASQTRHFGPGECGPVDETYIRVANSTGGQPFFLNPSETGKAFHLVRESSGHDQATILWATGKLDPAGQTFDVPIDSATSRVTFSLSVDRAGADLAIADPFGAAIQAGSDRAEITTLNCGRIVTVGAPTPGIWRLHVSGGGRFWLVAQGRSEISFVSVEFVHEGGRPGHQGLFRIPGQPLVGAPAILSANLSREGLTPRPTLHLVSERGDVIQDVHESPRQDDASVDQTGELVATLELPTQPFRVQANGWDAAGHPYQRVFQTLFHAETVEVGRATSVDELPAGAVTPVTFTVRNVGSAATFRIIAADSRRFVSRVEPVTVFLEKAAAASVTAWMAVPAGTLRGTGVDLTITATGESGTSNGTSVHLSVR